MPDHSPANTSAPARRARPDRFVVRARPMLLYVLGAVILWVVPIGILGAIRPQMGRDMAAAMSAYLTGLPDSFYALLGTAYLGYTAARQWGKARGTDR